MGILGYLLAGFIGFLIGVVISCVLLSKRGLEMYNSVQKSGAEAFDNAKGLYKAYMAEDEESEEKSEEAEQEESVSDDAPATATEDAE